MKDITVSFYVEALRRRAKDGTTHLVKAHTRHNHMILHRAVCEKEARDVAEGLTNALETTSYVFEG